MSCTPVVLTGIGLDCGNTGGVSKVYLVDKAHVTGVTFNGSMEVTAFTMEGSNKFKGYSFRRGNASMNTESSRDDQAGTCPYSTTVEVHFNRMESGKRGEMEKLAKGNTYAIVKDMNGLHWLVGYSTLDTYVAGSVQGTTGATMAEPNRYTLNLSTETPDLPYFVSGSIASVIS